MTQASRGRVLPFSEKTHELDAIASRILQIETELESYIPTTLWISDLHGEGDRFKSILRGRFGMLYQTCAEALPHASVEELRYLGRVIRQREYFVEQGIHWSMQQVIEALVKVLRYKVSNVQYRVEEVIMPEFRECILRMISEMPVPCSVLSEPLIAARLVYHLGHAIMGVLLDRIVVLGDIFDRGSQPDKIIRLLASSQYRRIVTLIFGNHDILWMGAAVGCKSLIIEALRVTCRYDHFELLRRLGFDLQQLEDFAVKHYPVEKITGKFKANTAKGRAMEKALTLIQFKLEDALIRSRPEYELDHRLILGDLVQVLTSGDLSPLNDSHFPTLDLANPACLSAEEIAVVEDLTSQFVNNYKLQRLMEVFFRQGETYHVHNNLLNIHALIPSTAEGEFDSFLGHRGKALLDFIQTSIRRVGSAYLEGLPREADDVDLFFYLWCGPKSPFFGKQAMKTYERYFLVDKETHEEPNLYWNANLKKAAFKQKILYEFDARRVIYGHTPVDVTKGKTMASDDGVAINVDGGFAAAYFNHHSAHPQ